MVFVLTLALAACQKSNNQPNDEQPAEQSQAEQGGTAGGAKPLKHRPKEERGKEQPKPAEARKVETITVPAGTALDVRLNDSISTRTASDGAPFQATLASPLSVNGVEVAPIDSAVTGTVTHAVSSGRLNRPAELSLTLTSLTLGGNQVNISTSTWSQKAASHKKRDAEMIGGGAGVGALIGALAGKGKGAAIGAAVGAGAGTAGAAATGRKEIVLGPESKLSFTLTAPLTLTRER